VIRFARERVGPSAAALVGGEPASVRRQLERGRDLTDSILSVVYERMAGDRALRDEFFHFFLREVLAADRRLARIPEIETMDLVQSVFGNVLGGSGGPRFEGRATYLSYLVRGLRWKAANRLRNHLNQRRATLQRAEEERSSTSAGPSRFDLLDGLVEREERARLLRAVDRLSGREREILRLHLAGESIHSIARHAGMSYDAARMALGRARASLR
jgi:RNA polymerase sigma factor (sigma-70 family)